MTYSMPTYRRHVVIDDFLPGDIFEEVAASWPLRDWGGWVSGDQRQPDKVVSDLHSELAFCFGTAAHLLASSRVELELGLVGTVWDLGLYAGGLHEIGPGGQLGTHLDAGHHARLGLPRTASAVLYVHPRWEDGWGGDLRLWSDPPEHLVASVSPAPNRLVVFAAAADAWHSVGVVTGPLPRRSLAVFGYGPGPAADTSRPRARFGGN